MKTTAPCSAALKPFVICALQEIDYYVQKEDFDHFVEYVCAYFHEQEPSYPKHYVQPAYFAPLLERLKDYTYTRIDR
jgi:hypothetical protein